MTTGIQQWRDKLIVIFLGAIFLFVVGCSCQVDVYWYDAQNYYDTALSFEQNGQFAFTNMVKTIRGYFLPFILYCFIRIGRMIGEQSIGFAYVHLAVTAFFTSSILTFFLPTILGGG